MDTLAGTDDAQTSPVSTDNSVRPEDGPQDVDQDTFGAALRRDEPFEEWSADRPDAPMDMAGGGGSTAAAVIEVARSQLGVTEEPPGSNRSAYGRWYGMDGSPWCAMFVSWCADQAGAADIIPKHAFTPSGAAWFKERGLWNGTPSLGAVVYFRWPTMGRIAHVGIVESVRADGAVVTIEGNTDASGGRTGGCVMRQVRRANIAGFGHPAYREGGQRAAQLQQAATTSGLTVDGELGRRTWAALQRALGVAADGEPGPVTFAALQRRVGSTPDGELGRRTIKALQMRLGCTPDGEWGPATTRALQAALNAGTF